MNTTSERLSGRMVDAHVLTFGDFTPKSGRLTPYFINMGNLRRGSHLATLGALYAAAINDAFGHDVDVLFGPAYKGIPIAAAASVSLSRDFGHDVGFAFDRKEVKDHGEGGQLVGHVPQDGDRVVIVEDARDHEPDRFIRRVIPQMPAHSMMSKRPNDGLGRAQPEGNQRIGGHAKTLGEVRDPLKVEAGGEEDRIDLAISLRRQELGLICIRRVVDLEIAAEQLHRELLELAGRRVDNQDSAVGFHGDLDRLIGRQA